MLENYTQKTDFETEEQLEQAKIEEKHEIISQWEKETKELEMEIKINQLIDQWFDQFKLDLYTDTKALPDLRNERNLSIEKMKDWKLQIKSYGETCELDLKTWKIYYMKLWEPIEARSDTEWFLTVSSEDFILKSSDLYKAFWKMNVINRAMSLANKTDKKDFYFREHWLLNEEILCVDWNNVLSFKWLKKRFGEDIAKEGIKDMFNRLVLL